MIKLLFKNVRADNRKLFYYTAYLDCRLSRFFLLIKLSQVNFSSPAATAISLIQGLRIWTNSANTWGRSATANMQIFYVCQSANHKSSNLYK
jgi:hypothetical protein